MEDGRVLTFVCMLRCWTWDAVPIQPRFHNSGQDANVRFRPLRLEFQPGMWHRFGLLWRRCDTAWAAGIGVIVPGAAV